MRLHVSPPLINIQIFPTMENSNLMDSMIRLEYTLDRTFIYNVLRGILTALLNSEFDETIHNFFNNSLIILEIHFAYFSKTDRIRSEYICRVQLRKPFETNEWTLQATCKLSFSTCENSPFSLGLRRNRIKDWMGKRWKFCFSRGRFRRRKGFVGCEFDKQISRSGGSKPSEEIGASTHPSIHPKVENHRHKTKSLARNNEYPENILV